MSAVASVASPTRVPVPCASTSSIVSGETPTADDEVHSLALPGVSNLHSHAFQRSFAGLTELRGPVDHFFRAHQVWLTKILKRGVARGEFSLPAPAPKVARFIFAALQGALLVKRATADPTQLNDVISVMKLQLASRA